MNIEIKHLYVGYDKKDFISDLSIICKSKQFTGIIGPNGCGKSTLLKSLYRVLVPNKGSILFDGNNIHKKTYKESAQQTAVLSQQPPTDLDLTVEEIVLMGRTPYKNITESDNEKDYAIARESMAATGILSKAQSSFTNLSGGEQQRVMLARALTQQTECLILDEPTNHLDIKYQLQILDIICKNKDKTIIAAIHDLNIASMYCNYIIAMKDGKIAFQGTPHQVFTSQNIKELYGVNAIIHSRKDGSPFVEFERNCYED